MLRANEPVLPNPLDVNIIVTIRSLDGNNSVHSDGIRALDATNWIKINYPTSCQLMFK